MVFLQLNYTMKAATEQPFMVTQWLYFFQGCLSATAPFYAINKPRSRSTLVRRRVSQNKAERFILARFVHSAHFFLAPKRGCKKTSFFYIPFKILI